MTTSSIVFVLLLVWLIFGGLTALVASTRGRSALGWFFAGAAIGPLALFVVGFMPALTVDGHDAGSQRKCPECAELILREARRCKHCGAAVEPAPAMDGLLGRTDPRHVDPVKSLVLGVSARHKRDELILCGVGAIVLAAIIVALV